MTDKFARHHPGSEEAGFLALVLIRDLLGLLRQKGALSADDVTGLLETTANNLSQSPNALAKRGARFIHEAMLPVENFN